MSDAAIGHLLALRAVLQASLMHIDEALAALGAREGCKHSRTMEVGALGAPYRKKCLDCGEEWEVESAVQD